MSQGVLRIKEFNANAAKKANNANVFWFHSCNWRIRVTFPRPWGIRIESFPADLQELTDPFNFEKALRLMRLKFQNVQYCAIMITDDMAYDLTLLGNNQ